MPKVRLCIQRAADAMLLCCCASCTTCFRSRLSLVRTPRTCWCDILHQVGCFVFVVGWLDGYLVLPMASNSRKVRAQLNSNLFLAEKMRHSYFTFTTSLSICNESSSGIVRIFVYYVGYDEHLQQRKAYDGPFCRFFFLGPSVFVVVSHSHTDK